MPLETVAMTTTCCEDELRGADGANLDSNANREVEEAVSGCKEVLSSAQPRLALCTQPRKRDVCPPARVCVMGCCEDEPPRRFRV